MFEVDDQGRLTYDDEPVLYQEAGLKSPLKSPWFTAPKGELDGRKRKLPTPAVEALEVALEDGEVKHDGDSWVTVVPASETQPEPDEQEDEDDQPEPLEPKAEVQPDEVLEHRDRQVLVYRTRVADFSQLTLGQAWRGVLRQSLVAARLMAVRVLAAKRLGKALGWFGTLALLGLVLMQSSAYEVGQALAVVLPVIAVISVWRWLRLRKARSKSPKRGIDIRLTIRRG